MRVRRGGGMMVVLALVVVASVLPVGAVSEVGAGSVAVVGSDAGLVAVGVGGFSDVGEGSVHAPAVEALAADGVFDGTECGQGLFCPGDPILRWEMAVWLVRVLDRTEPDTVGFSRFADVYTDVWWASYVERFAELEVTEGCATDPLRYCPDEVATRAQMASFLVRAFGFPAGASAGFSDVGVGEAHTANVDALAASRVTAGCSAAPLRFCPDRNVTRGQMATFLARAAGLVDLPAPVGAEPEEMPVPVFDPFTTPTLSDIDLERLGAAVATLDPEADCPATVASGSLDDVAEVVRISGGCLNVEYVVLVGRTVVQVREELADDPEVHAVGLPVTDVFPVDFHSDEAGMDQWHLEEIGADVLWLGGQTQDGRDVGVWPAGADVVVAVIDTGVDGAHPDLDGNLDTSVDMCHRTDPDGHGTHVAGIVAAERNEQDVVGVAPQATILPIRLSPVGACGFSATAAVDLAIEQGADVINMSLWWGTPDEPRQTEIDLSGQDTFEAALRAAMMRDIVPVIAAGNCGIQSNHPSCKDNNVYVPNRVTLPAAYSGVISVASIDDNGKRSDFSTANRHVGIAAPGRDILSTVPNNGTALDEGTSMAAPVVAGVVAHMKARFPEASVGEIRQALYTTAVNPDSGRTGHFTWEYGWGVVRPAAAILKLAEYFFSCDALFESGKRLVAYDIDVDIDADGDTAHDDRVGLFERRDVWLADEDGDNWCRVAANAAHPAWSPDGEQLAFAHRMPDPKRVQTTNDKGETGFVWVDEGRVDIWVTPTEGGPWRRVINTAAEEYDLDWSAGGQIAYTANTGAGFEIWVVDASGSGESTDLTGPIPDSEFPGSQFQPSWSPDATMIAYTSDQGGDNDIWVMNADGSNPRNLTTGVLFTGGRILTDGKEEQPAWSPDGSRIVYVSDRNGGDNDIWVMNADGTGHRNLHDNNNPEWKPAWSPDGSRIVFVHNTGEDDADDDIWTMDAQTGQGWTLITTATADDVRFNAAAESNPAWSLPDDRQVRISWGSDAAGRTDCPTDVRCWNLRYEYIGSWEAAPYTLECWSNGQKAKEFPWSGRETTGCLYWGGTAQVIIDGVRSNELTVPTAPPPPDDREVRISWGSDASGRPDCSTGEACLYLQYEYIGSWEPPPYTLECWENGQKGWMGQWTGRSATGCYYGGPGTAHVVIDGIRSNTINWTPPPTEDPPALTAASSIASGVSHSCALRADGTAECWGANPDGAASPPGGVFTAISAGSWHTCGLRTDGAVECWGADWEGQATPPAGSFTVLASGHGHTCGLRTDGRVVCWGTNDFGQTDTPDGVFTAIAADVLHSCGIRTDRSIECWGTTYNFSTPSGAFTALNAWCAIRTGGTIDCFGDYARTPPDGRFEALSSGGIFYSCGLRIDGTVECWWQNVAGQSTPPGGTFTAIATGAEYSCGIRTDGTVECWGYEDGRTTPPGGTFASVSAGSEHTCGVRTDGTVECWGSDRAGETSPPSGSFSEVGTGFRYGCGLRVGGTIECWGLDWGSRVTPPGGAFTRLSVGHAYGCAIRTDKTVACWGDNSWGQATPPAGTFTAIAASAAVVGPRSCGIRTDGTIECWGDSEHGGPAPPAGTFTALTDRCGLRTDGTVECWGNSSWERGTSPQGGFTALTSGPIHTCGIRTDGTAACWGYHWDGRATPPTGTFVTISAGSEHTCGVRTDGTIECWGYNDGRTTPPAGRFGPSKN